ncbi:MAG: thioesterase family protein [Hyphomonadaceae bacterium]
MKSLAQSTALEQVSDMQWRATLTKDWALWSPAGGFLTALALRAAGQATEFPRPISFACQFLRRAVFEPVDLQVTSLRNGRRTQALRIDMSQDDRLILTAQVWVGLAESKGMVHDDTLIAPLCDPDNLPDYNAVYPDDPMPEFFDRFDHRPIDPVKRNDKVIYPAVIEGYYRLVPPERSDDAFIDAGRIMLLIDTYAWLANYPAHPSDGPSPWIAPNLDFYYRFHRSTVGEDWLHMRNEADLAENGLIAASGAVRNRQGQLLARGVSQLICMPRPILD